MTDDHDSRSCPEDLALRTVLQKHDPADIIFPHDCAKLEMSIIDRISGTPQLGVSAESRDYFMIPRFMGGALSWPMTLATTMAFGLMLGFFISSQLETPAPSRHDTITTAMAEPWPEPMQ